MSIMKTATQIAMEKTAPKAAKAASKSVSKTVDIPQLLLGHDPKFDKSYLGRNAIPKRNNNLINYVGPGGDTVRLPGGAPKASPDILNQVSYGQASNQIKPFGVKELDPTSSRNKIVGYNESAENLNIELGNRGVPINELLASQKAEKEIYEGFEDRERVFVTDFLKKQRRQEKLAARKEYYSGTNKGAHPLEGVYIADQRGVGDNAVSDILSPSPYLNERTTEAATFRFAAEEAEQTGSVVGLLRKQNELFSKQRGFENEMAMHLKANDYTSAAYADAQARRLGRESELYNDPIKDLERNAKKNIKKMRYNTDGVNVPRYEGGQGPTITRDQYNEVINRKLYSQDAYDEAVHLRNNNATSTNAMNGGTSGPTSPPSSNTPVNPTTTPTGSSDYSGFYVPSQGNTASSVSTLNMLNESGGAGIMASIGLGAVLGGSANYAMGGEFGEGAVMGGLAGGALKIGARAIQANETSIENYLQRTALGDQFTSGMTREQAGRAIQNMNEAPEGLMRGMAYNVLKSEAPSVGMQSRYAVMGGSMLSGVAFTGRRNDKRRGFNAHRGNRI